MCSCLPIRQKDVAGECRDCRYRLVLPLTPLSSLYYVWNTKVALLLLMNDGRYLCVLEGKWVTRVRCVVWLARAYGSRSPSPPLRQCCRVAAAVAAVASGLVAMEKMAAMHARALPMALLPARPGKVGRVTRNTRPFEWCLMWQKQTKIGKIEKKIINIRKDEQRRWCEAALRLNRARASKTSRVLASTRCTWNWRTQRRCAGPRDLKVGLPWRSLPPPLVADAVRPLPPPNHGNTNMNAADATRPFRARPTTAAVNTILYIRIKTRRFQGVLKPDRPPRVRPRTQFEISAHVDKKKVITQRLNP